ncbi:hypothetical protein [Actinokineospora sp.]|uniref:hypothetical protein n=1 Tax=Actinokineospora sp. TaxID=1872133 RepID=UPI00403804E9
MTEFTPRWGQSIVDPTRGHVRETCDGEPRRFTVDGAEVGVAVCGALLVAGMPATDDFAACSTCVDVLAQLPR